LTRAIVSLLYVTQLKPIARSFGQPQNINIQAISMRDFSNVSLIFDGSPALGQTPAGLENLWQQGNIDAK